MKKQRILKSFSKSLETKYLKLIKSKKMSKQDIYCFKKMFNGLRFLNDFNMQPKPEHILRVNDIKLLLSQLYYGVEYQITKEQTKQGIEYLKRFCFTTKNITRKQAHTCFSLEQIAMISNFSKFRFVGFYEIPCQYHIEYMPVWRLYSKKGNSFDYICGHWGKPEVL